MKTFYMLRSMILLFLLIVSCAPQSVGETLEGNWAMDTLMLSEKSIFEDVVIVNMMSFDKEGVLTIPKIAKDKVIRKDERIGKWYYDEETHKMTLETNSDYLNGIFNFCFKKDLENKYIKMVLQNDSIYMEAGKILSEDPRKIELPVECGEITSKDIQYQ